MKLDFNFQIFDLEGKVEVDQFNKEINVGKVLANALYKTPSKAIDDPMKSVEWAKSLYVGNVINLDKSDQLKLKAFIQKDCVFSPSLIVPMLDVFEKKEETSPSQETV